MIALKCNKCKKDTPRNQILFASGNCEACSFKSVKIRIEHKLSSDRLTRHKELSAIEAAIRACNPGLGIWESWGDEGAIIYELREKK